MIETISENDNKVFKEKVEKLLSEGYKISSTDCGYAGEVGGNVYDCEYWMAILTKEKAMQKKDLKTGMIVMTNNGFFYLVLRDTGMDISEYKDKDVLLGISSSGNITSGWMGLSDYNDDLENKDEDYSISEIFVVNCAANIGKIKHYKSAWKRELTR